MSRQTSLPEALTRNEGIGTGFATGFSVNRPLPVRPEQPENQPARVTDFRQHRFNSRTYTVGTDAAQIVGANELRRFLSFQNNGGATVFLAFGIQASVTGENSFVLPINGYLSFEFGIVPNNEIWAISTTSVNITVIEGSIL